MLVCGETNDEHLGRVDREEAQGIVRRREETMIGAPGKGELCNLLVECTSEMTVCAKQPAARGNVEEGSGGRMRVSRDERRGTVEEDAIIVEGYIVSYRSYPSVFFTVLMLVL